MLLLPIETSAISLSPYPTITCDDEERRKINWYKEQEKLPVEMSDEKQVVVDIGSDVSSNDNDSLGKWKCFTPYY